MILLHSVGDVCLHCVVCAVLVRVSETCQCAILSAQCSLFSVQRCGAAVMLCAELRNTVNTYLRRCLTQPDNQQESKVLICMLCAGQGKPGYFPLCGMLSVCYKSSIKETSINELGCQSCTAAKVLPSIK